MTKHLSLLFFILYCCFAGRLSAGNTFEGNLILTSDKNGTATDKTVFAIKNDLVAIEPGKGPQTVLNVSTGDFFTIINQGGKDIVAKLNVEVLNSLSELPAFLGPLSGYIGVKAGESEVKATDEYKTISGYKCRKYIVKDSSMVSTIWAAKDFPFSLGSLMDMLKIAGGSNPWFRASLPLQGSIKNIKTNEVSGFSISVEKKPLDDKLFVMPKDLFTVDMTPLVQQMMQTNDPAQIKRVLDSLIPR